MGTNVAHCWCSIERLYRHNRGTGFLGGIDQLSCRSQKSVQGLLGTIFFVFPSMLLINLDVRSQTSSRQ